MVSKLGLVFHTVGVTTMLVCSGWAMVTFMGILVSGKSFTYLEPNLFVLVPEVCLYSFALGYAFYLLKFVWFGQLKKLVWEKQRKEFYKVE